MKPPGEMLKQYESRINILRKISIGLSVTKFIAVTIYFYIN